MEARINETRMAGVGRFEEGSVGEALHNAQYALLNELPGVVFGFLTLTWIITSLIHLL